MLRYILYLKNYWESQYDEHPFVDYEKHFSLSEPCNIYLIGIRPRICIVPDYLEAQGQDVKLKFKIQDKFDFPEVSATLRLNRMPAGKIWIETEAPYSRFNLIDDEGYFFDKVKYQEDDVRAKSLYALRNSVSESDFAFNDLEILYVGKSVKMDPKISAVKRIQNHQKMQRILEQCTGKYFDKEVYVILCSFVAKTDLIGLGKEMLQIKDIKKHIVTVSEQAVKLKSSNDFITQVAEAALIDFFDTREFNKDFIGSFGRKTHSYYNQIMEGNVSTVILEVDFSGLGNIFTKRIPSRAKHLVTYYPKEDFRKETDEFLLNGFFNADLDAADTD